MAPRWDTTDPVATNSGNATDYTPRVIAAADSPEVLLLAAISGAVAAGRVKVDPVVGQTGVAAGAGAADAHTQRTVAATDSPDVTILDLSRALLALIKDDVDTLAGTVAGGKVATAATQSGLWAVRLQDGSGNALSSSAAGGTRPLDAAWRDVNGLLLGSGTNPVRTDPTGSTAQPVKLQDGAGNGVSSVATGTARSLDTVQRDATGNVLGNAANPVRVDPTGSTAQPAKLQDGAGNALTSAVAGSTRPLDTAWRDASGVLLGSVGNPVRVAGEFAPSGTSDVNLVKVGGTSLSAEDARVPTMSKSYYVGVAEGDISNHEDEDFFGERAALGTTAGGEDIWNGTAAVQPIPGDAGVLLSVVSTDVNDTLAGTGAQKVKIEYITPAGAVAEVEVNMNGTTPVDTAVTARFVQKAWTSQLGTAYGAAAGNIKIYLTGTAGTVYEQIPAGANRSTSAHFFVPVGRVLYLTEWFASAAGTKIVTIRLRATSIQGVRVANIPYSHFTGQFLDAAYERLITVPHKFPALTILSLRAIVTQTGAAVAGGARGWTEAA